jgi:tRNA dimethylallyltransferase
MAVEAIEGIWARGRRPLLVCGTPLYLKALLWGLFPGPGADAGIRQHLREQAAWHGTGRLHSILSRVDPLAAERIGPRDLKRIERALEVYELTGQPISARQYQFQGPPQIEHVAVGLRFPRSVLYKRIDHRVDRMMEGGLLEEVRRLRGRLGPQAGQAVGFRELVAYLDGQCSLAEAVDRIKRNTRRLAKHQITWFRHFPQVRWIDIGENLGLEGIADRCGNAFVEPCTSGGFELS